MNEENEDKALSEVYYDLWNACIKFSNEKKVDNQICNEYYQKFKEHSTKLTDGKSDSKSNTKIEKNKQNKQNNIK